MLDFRIRITLIENYYYSRIINGCAWFFNILFVDTIWLFILLYAIFQGLFAPAMPQLYASARESINDKELVTVKVKYIDKRHWRRLIDREYTEVKVNNNRFKGIIGLVTMKKVRDPLEVTVVGQNIIVADDNYKWLQILPEKKRYSITVMFDNKGNPLEYYFDINIKNITQKVMRVQ